MNINAFPHVVFNSDGEVLGGSDGMTLRDYFAAHALPSLISIWKTVLTDEGEEFNYGWDGNKPNSACYCVADDAYAIAEAMLKVREATNG
jgi:chorismate synthase